MKKFLLIVLSFILLTNNSFAEEEVYEYAPVKKKEVIMPKEKPNTDMLKKIKSNAGERSSYRIVALINGEVLSSEDIQSRMNAFVMTTRIPMNAETEPMIFQRVLHNSVDEKLKIQEATKNGIIISEKEVDDAIKSFEKNNKIPDGELKKILKHSNVNEETFRTQMKSDLAWVKLVRKKTLAEGTVTQKEVETALADAKKDLATEKYMISEIFIKKEDAKNLDGLVSNLRADPRFELYAMQFSQSPSASSGGKLGWVDKEKLLPKIKAAIDKMKEGDVSNPINVNGDFYIVKLNKTFDPKKDDTPTVGEKEMTNFLESKKMENIANQLLQQLRQVAIIELRN